MNTARCTVHFTVKFRVLCTSLLNSECCTLHTVKFTVQYTSLHLPGQFLGPRPQNPSRVKIKLFKTCYSLLFEILQIFFLLTKSLNYTLFQNETGRGDNYTDIWILQRINSVGQMGSFVKSHLN